MLGDIDGDGKADIVGFSNTSVVTSLSSKPDLTPTYFNVVKEPLNKGDQINVAFKLENIGDKQVNNLTVSFYLSKDNNITTTDHLLGSYVITNVGANNVTDLLTETYNLPDIANPFWDNNSTYYVGMLIDPNSQINEYDETNNGNNQLAGIDFDTIAINPPKPDLIVVDPLIGNANATVNVGEDVLISAKVKNDSNVTASHSNIRYWLSNDQILDDEDIYLGDDYIPELTGNSSYEQSFTFTYESSLGSGQKYIIFEADPYQEILESNKSNNLGFCTD
jgi:hypothetical protein